ncbi:MAG: hypothetical protein JXA21_20075 [Anaerolineae bacterium]|nr:hypothetical protein [Anaerolineae bacterium]
MSPHILKRCDVCKRWGARFLVETASGKTYLCYDCWKVRHAPPAPEPSSRPKRRR